MIALRPVELAEGNVPPVTQQTQNVLQLRRPATYEVEPDHRTDQRRVSLQKRAGKEQAAALNNTGEDLRRLLVLELGDADRVVELLLQLFLRLALDRDIRALRRAGLWIARRTKLFEPALHAFEAWCLRCDHGAQLVEKRFDIAAQVEQLAIAQILALEGRLELLELQIDRSRAGSFR